MFVKWPLKKTHYIIITQHRTPYFQRRNKCCLYPSRMYIKYKVTLKASTIFFYFLVYPLITLVIKANVWQQRDYLTAEHRSAKRKCYVRPCTYIQGDSFGTRPKKMRIYQRLFIRFWTCIYDYIPCFMRSMSILVCHFLTSWRHRDNDCRLAPCRVQPCHCVVR